MQKGTEKYIKFKITIYFMANSFKEKSNMGGKKTNVFYTSVHKGSANNGNPKKILSTYKFDEKSDFMNRGKVQIKNKKVYVSTFKKVDAYDKKAITEYNKGNMKKGDKYADKSDAVYAKNYDKMFEIVSNRGVQGKN